MPLHHNDHPAGSRSIYILILFYGASTATTTLPCIFHVIGSDALATGSNVDVAIELYPFLLTSVGDGGRYGVPDIRHNGEGVGG